MKKIILLLLLSVSAIAQRTIEQKNVKNLADSLAKKVDKVAGKGLSTNDYTTTEKNKLAGIATGATANSTDAQLRDRSTHTGTQLASTISNFSSSVISSLPQTLDNNANPLFIGIDLRRQTNIPTPSLGIRLGNIAGNLILEDSLGFVRTVPTLQSSQTWLGANTFAGSDNTTQFIATSNNNSFGINPANNLIRSSHGFRFDVNSASSQKQAMQIFANGNLLLQNGGTFTDAGFRFDVNGTARIANGVNLATTSGNVGIGTIIPNSKLQVDGQLDGGTNLVSFQNTGTGRSLFVVRDVSIAQRPVVSFLQTRSDGGTPTLTIRQADNTQGAISINSDGNLSTFNFQIFGNGLVKTVQDVEITDSTKGIILKSPDGTRYIIKVSNGGTLTATAL